MYVHKILNLCKRKNCEAMVKRTCTYISENIEKVLGIN